MGKGIGVVILLVCIIQIGFSSILLDTNGSFQNSTSLSYGNYIQSIQTSCSLTNSTNTTFSIQNLYHSNITHNQINMSNVTNQTYTESVNIIIDTSGAWFFETLCTNTTHIEQQNQSVFIPFGNLSLDFIVPNATQVRDYFESQVTITCVGGECVNISVYLDPQENKPKAKMKKMVDNITEDTVNIYYTKKEDEQTIIKEKVTIKKLKELLDDDSIEDVQLNAKRSTFLDVEVPRLQSDRLQNTMPFVNGTGYTVCIVDTGINYSHPDFTDVYLGGHDFVNNDADPMDDEGHGTHVAGIIASQNDTYTGYSPGAKIVAVKVLDSDGSGFDVDIVAGINWCITNRNTFNISIITLSLGSGNYSTRAACDADPFNSDYVTAYANAVNAGMYVFGAAGNCQSGGGSCPASYPNQIAAPACVTNSIPIGAVSVGDTLAPFSMRGSFMELAGPGVNIDSTDYTGGHTLKSGTSMATPAVVGIAVQMLELAKKKYDLTLTQEQLVEALRTNNITIVDTGTSGRNYAMPFINDSLSLSFLGKGLVSTNANATPFYTIHPNPYSYNTNTSLVSLRNTSVTFNWTVNATGNYNIYTFFAFANSSNIPYMNSTHYNLTITDYTTPIIMIISNQTVTNQTNVTFSYSVFDAIDETVNCNLTINNSQTTIIDEQTLSANNVSYNYSIVLNQTEYNWSVYCIDAQDNSVQTANQQINVDTSLPTFISTINGTQGRDNWYTTAVINITIIDENPQYIIYNVTNRTGTYPFTTTNETILYNITSIGNTTIVYYGNDTLGYNSNASNISVEFDNTIPTVGFISVNNTAPQINESINISVTTNDTFLANVTFRLSNSSNYSVTPSENISWRVFLIEDSFSINVTAMDYAGNRNSSRKQISYALKNTTNNFTFSNTSFDNTQTLRTNITFSMRNVTQGNITLTKFEELPLFVQNTSVDLIRFLNVNLSANVKGNLSYAILRMYYNDSDLIGLTEESLSMYWYNESNMVWTNLSSNFSFVNSTGVNISANFIWANVSNFSTYAFSANRKTCSSGSVPSTGCYDNTQTLRTSGSICSSSWTASSNCPSSGGGSSDGGSGGSSSGGGSASAPIVKTVVVSEEQTKVLFRLNAVNKFTLNSKNVTVNITNIDYDLKLVSFIVNEAYIVLGENQTSRLDTDSDGYYDVKIGITSLSLTSATFTLKEIYEQVALRTTSEPVQEEILVEEFIENELIEEPINVQILDVNFAPVFIVAILVLMVVYYVRRK